ncbi:MAG: cytochrome c oxidase subunit II, partial [FCB group bacterium]|nr:cytochrome c oxidase subunit II [FCB group bacterium]
MWNFPLLPEVASTFAGQVDAVFFALTALSVLFSAIICVAIIYFAVKYRRGSKADRSNPVHTSLKLELSWSIIPFILGLGIFVWATIIYVNMYTMPKGDALKINVVAKQWMWKFQHPNGRREINDLHVPTGRPVELTMTSQDVIHSFFVPAFRAKRDVLPGRVSTAWFEATKPGKYHLFCAEYCGTEHSLMGGTVHVMEPQAYQEWLTTGNASSETPVQAGERLFNSYGCAVCHGRQSTFRAPKVEGLFGSQVKLKDGNTVTADEQYLRESILHSQAKIVAGYDPV